LPNGGCPFFTPGSRKFATKTFTALGKKGKKRGGWDAGLTADMLSWYQQENPLENRQWQVLKWELLYPHLFEGIMTKYYEKREKTWSPAKYYSRLQDMIAVEKTLGHVMEGFEGLIPREA